MSANSGCVSAIPCEEPTTANTPAVTATVIVVAMSASSRENPAWLRQAGLMAPASSGWSPGARRCVRPSHGPAERPRLRRLNGQQTSGERTPFRAGRHRSHPARFRRDRSSPRPVRVGPRAARAAAPSSARPVPVAVEPLRADMLLARDIASTCASAANAPATRPAAITTSSSEKPRSLLRMPDVVFVAMSGRKCNARSRPSTGAWTWKLERFRDEGRLGDRDRCRGCSIPCGQGGRNCRAA